MGCLSDEILKKITLVSEWRLCWEGGGRVAEWRHWWDDGWSWARDWHYGLHRQKNTCDYAEAGPVGPETASGGWAEHPSLLGQPWDDLSAENWMDLFVQGPREDRLWGAPITGWGQQMQLPPEKQQPPRVHLGKKWVTVFSVTPSTCLMTTSSRASLWIWKNNNQMIFFPGVESVLVISSGPTLKLESWRLSGSQAAWWLMWPHNIVSLTLPFLSHAENPWSPLPFFCFPFSPSSTH